MMTFNFYGDAYFLDLFVYSDRDKAQQFLDNRGRGDDLAVAGELDVATITSCGAARPWRVREFADVNASAWACVYINVDDAADYADVSGLATRAAFHIAHDYLSARGMTWDDPDVPVIMDALTVSILRAVDASVVEHVDVVPKSEPWVCHVS